ncbi:MAG: hypothetical protein P8124_08580 [Gammaproteobacteria bacterium]
MDDADSDGTRRQFVLALAGVIGTAAGVWVGFLVQRAVGALLGGLVGAISGTILGLFAL